MKHLRHSAAAGCALACLALVAPEPAAAAPKAPATPQVAAPAQRIDAEFGTYEQCVGYPVPEKFHWPRATIEAFCADEFTPTITRREIREMIEAGEGRKLDAKFDAILRDYKSGKLPEGAAWNAYGRFDRKDDKTGALIARWLEQSPRSAHALAARGIHRVARGADARGTKFYNEIPSEDVARMERELELANDDLQKAVAANPRILRAYGALINSVRMYGRRDLGRWALNEALRVDPKNFYVRGMYMGMLQPMWGGSFEEMDELAASAEPWIKQNPRLVNLEAWALTHRGFRDYQQNRDAIALQKFERGLAIGPMGQDLYLAGVAATNVKRYEYAVELLSQRLRFDPYNTEVRVWRANAYVDLGKIDQARSDLDVALEESPQDLYALRKYAFVLMKQRDYKGAEAKLVQAREVDRADLWVTKQLAWIYIYIKRTPKEAEPLVAELLEKEPKNGGAWLLRADVIQNLGLTGLHEAAENFVRYADITNEEQRLALPKVKAWLASHPANAG